MSSSNFEAAISSHARTTSTAKRASGNLGALAVLLVVLASAIAAGGLLRNENTRVKVARASSRKRRNVLGSCRLVQNLARHANGATGTNGPDAAGTAEVANGSAPVTSCNIQIQVAMYVRPSLK